MIKDITAFIRSNQNVFLALVYFGVIWPLYVVINHLELHDHFKKHVLETSLDRLIPFEPKWVLAYASMYVIVILPFIYIRDRTIYKHMFFSFCLTGLIAYVVFLVFPTFDIMRPVTNPFDFDRFMLAMDNKHDSPYNCFPSLHVGFATTAGLWSYYADRGRIGLAILVWSILVSLSVLFVKEHYIADLVGGAVLSSVLFYIFSRKLKDKIIAPRGEWLHRRYWLLVPILLYLAEVIYVLIKYKDQVNAAIWP